VDYEIRPGRCWKHSLNPANGIVEPLPTEYVGGTESRSRKQFELRFEQKLSTNTFLDRLLRLTER